MRQLRGLDAGDGDRRWVLNLQFHLAAGRETSGEGTERPGREEIELPQLVGDQGEAEASLRFRPMLCTPSVIASHTTACSKPRIAKMRQRASELRNPIRCGRGLSRAPRYLGGGERAARRATIPSWWRRNCEPGPRVSTIRIVLLLATIGLLGGCLASAVPPTGSTDKALGV